MWHWGGKQILEVTMEYKFSDKVGNKGFDGLGLMMSYLKNPDIIPFAGGSPDSSVFPNKKLAELAKDILMKNPVTALQYNIPIGYEPLRELSAKRSKEKCGAGRDFDRVVITSGGAQGIDITARILLNEGDTVVAENPSFMGSIGSFKSFCANVVGAEMEDDGVNLEQLENAFKIEKNVKFFYCIPNFNNPTGLTTSLEKRKKIYELCKKYGVLIVEDNPYGELRFSGEAIPSIKSFDEDGIVIYVSSYSKIIAPGIRIGFVIAPEKITEEIVRVKQFGDLHTNVFWQMLVTEFVNSVDFDTHIDNIKNLYARKCTLMMSELNKKFDKSIKIAPAKGGMFLWCTLPETDMDTIELFSITGERGVVFIPGMSFVTDSRKTSNSFRLNFTMPSEEQIIKGSDILSNFFN
jgi:2-aminoadipate transaminase